MRVRFAGARTPAAGAPAARLPAGFEGADCDRTSGGKDTFALLTDVRVGTHPGYDRIVFEFVTTRISRRRPLGVPRYEITRAETPLTEDPSGLPLSVGGSVFLGIVFHGAKVSLERPGLGEADRGGEGLRDTMLR